MYSRRDEAESGVVNVVSSDKYFFNDLKAAACSGPQAKSLALHSVLMKGRLRSANREMNLFNAASLPVILWTSQVDCVWVMSIMAYILAGIPSMPL
jgi:hypothetical protein